MAEQIILDIDADGVYCADCGFYLRGTSNMSGARCHLYRVNLALHMGHGPARCVKCLDADLPAETSTKKARIQRDEEHLSTAERVTEE